MATRRRQSESPPLEIRQFTPEEIRQSITKLKRRIAEVQDLQTDHVLYKDQRVRNTEENISTTILEIFGERSPQYKSYGRHSIRPMTVIFGDIPESESQREFLDGIPQTVKMLEGLITWLEEKQVDMGHDPSTRARAAFSDLDLHLRITDVCADLYRDGHYRNAVLDGAVALVNFVKERSRRHDLDGAPLMRTVFSKNTPILAFNDLSDQTDLDHQEGMMHLFEGAVLALRNPRAHALLNDSPEDALEYIALLSSTLSTYAA